MVASKFIIFGPEIGSNSAIARVDVVGISVDGSVQFVDKNKNEYMVETDEIGNLSNQDLIMTKSKAKNADKELMDALEAMPDLPAEASNKTKQLLREAKAGLFRTVVESAE